MSNPSKLSQRRAGFTLIEMTVVMAIIAVLMLLTAGGLMSLRNQYVVDRAAEEAIMVVREAQNRSVSFTQGSGNSTKLWGARFDQSLNTINLISVDAAGVNIVENTANILPGTGISTANGSHIYFSSPFATPYLFNGPCDTGAGGTPAWSESETNPSREFVPNTSISACNPITTNITVNLTYRGKNATITINQRGDVSAN